MKEAATHCVFQYTNYIKPPKNTVQGYSSRNIEYLQVRFWAK